MEFVDYKCLESLITEGEGLIATEGLGSMIMTLIKGAFSLLGRVFSTIANIFRNIYNKLRSKRAVKKDSTEKSNSEPKESVTKNTPTKVNIPSDEEFRKTGEKMANAIKESPRYKELQKNNDEPKQEIKSNIEKSVDNGHSTVNAVNVKMVLTKGDDVTKELNYLLDACSTITRTVFYDDMNEDYTDAVEFIDKHVKALEEKHKEFVEEANKFKDDFEKNHKYMNTETRDELCKTASRRAEEYTKFAERCEKKLKRVYDVPKRYIEDVKNEGADIQMLRAPAQKGLSAMNKYATASIKVYNEINNLLVSAVIVD